MRYIFFFSLMLLATSVHAQFGTRLSADKNATNPTGFPTTTTVPSILSREDKPSPSAGFESVKPTPYPGLETSQPIPMVNGAQSPRSGQRLGITMMTGAGYGFGLGYGIGSASRVGYSFPFGLYLGMTGLLSIGTDFTSGTPMVMSSPAWLNNNLLGAELGFEIPVKIFGGQFFSRPYAGIGLLWSNLNFFGFPQTGFGNTIYSPSAGVALNNSAPFGLNAVFYSVGNVFYYQIPQFFILRNLLVGVDLRHAFVTERNGFFAVPMIGMYF
ncbi:MAG: hypothetical protein ACK41G_03530 [Candidatus Thermochlorobacter sp.]